MQNWTPETDREPISFPGPDNMVWSVTSSPDGSQLASGSNDKTVKIWDATTGEIMHNLEGHNGSIRGVAFSPDGSRLVSVAIMDNTVRVWDTMSIRDPVTFQRQ